VAFREQSAPQLVDLILSLGGIYVKIGQVMSTIGAGLLPEEYIRALRPLQDGVPAKSIEEISDKVHYDTSHR
jgi:predicted unusual protein kinase regulating ubiquinone biosynthesis (AarF/ABC1/UbiB family)